MILVGNGPSLLGSGLGPKIDSYDEVVRFNNYNVDGFSADVGTKTTVWSRWFRLAVKRPMINLNAIWINTPIQDRSKAKWKIAMEMVEPFSEKSVLIPEKKVAEDIQLKLYGSLSGDKWPSSGLLAIEHAIAQGYDVTIAGIDSWAKGPAHYYENHDRSETHHVDQLEKTHIEYLLNQKVLTSLTHRLM